MNESFLVAIGFAIVGLILIYAYDCWIQPWIYAYNRWVQARITRRWITDTLKKAQAGEFALPRQQSDYRISVNDLGFTVSRIRPTSALVVSGDWSDVLRVTAFKRDWLTVDCICMAIATKDGTTTEVNEEMTGWDAFTEDLPRYLPGSMELANWFSRVAFPAFATNETQIFARDHSPK